MQSGPLGSHFFRDQENERISLPLFVSASGSSLWPPGHGFERAFTGFWGIELVTHGALEFEQDSLRAHLSQGDLFLLRYGSTNSYRATNASRACKRYLQLRGGALAQIISTLGLGEVDWIKLDTKAYYHVRSQMRQIHAQCRNPTAQADLENSVQIYRLLTFISGLMPGARTECFYTRRIIDWIRQRTDQPVSSLECAEQAGISLTHLNRLMNNSLGCSVKRFIVKHKMTVAANLLRETDATISQIAAQTGYEDPLYFSGRFTAFFGRGPSEYRRWARTQRE